MVGHLGGCSVYASIPAQEEQDTKSKNVYGGIAWLCVAGFCDHDGSHVFPVAEIRSAVLAVQFHIHPALLWDAHIPVRYHPEVSPAYRGRGGLLGTVRRVGVCSFQLSPVICFRSRDNGMDNTWFHTQGKV